MPNRVILSGGTVVLSHQLMECASVVVEDERIVSVEPRIYPCVENPTERVINAAGRLIMPGLVDVHNDALEAEINPRPKANLPLDLSLDTADRRLAASGVSTELHAIFFANYDRKERRLEDAPERVREIQEFADSANPLVRHEVLLRADLWSLDSIEHVIRASEEIDLPVISLNDHTPGQGQYRDAASLKLYLQQVVGQSAEEAESNIRREIDRAHQEPNIAIEVLKRVRALAAERDIVLVSHDDDSADRVEQMYAAGARVGEFPVNLEAARRQRDLGMTIVMGAPNIVRGGSASGNISASHLLNEGLVDVLCADYYSPAMLYAVKKLSDSGALSLVDAVRLVTLNPARAIGMGERRGSIEAGKDADLLLVDLRRTVPSVELMLIGGSVRFQARSRRPVAVAV